MCRVVKSDFMLRNCCFYHKNMPTVSHMCYDFVLPIGGETITFVFFLCQPSEQISSNFVATFAASFCSVMGSRQTVEGWADCPSRMAFFFSTCAKTYAYFSHTRVESNETCVGPCCHQPHASTSPA